MEVEDSADGQWWNLEPLQHFGSKVAWVSSDQIWWKIIYVAEAFQKEDHWNSYKWLKDVFAKNVENSQKFLEKQLRKCNAEVNDPGEPCVRFSRENENNLQAHICRTEGLLHFFFQWGDVCRDDNVFGSILDRMKMICASIMEFSWHLQQQLIRFREATIGVWNKCVGRYFDHWFSTSFETSISSFLAHIQNNLD